jgi:hypothetical protein
MDIKLLSYCPWQNSYLFIIHGLCSKINYNSLDQVNTIVPPEHVCFTNKLILFPCLICLKRLSICIKYSPLACIFSLICIQRSFDKVPVSLLFVNIPKTCQGTRNFSKLCACQGRHIAAWLVMVPRIIV